MEIVVWLLVAGVSLLALAVLLRSSHGKTDWQRIVRQRTAYAKAQRELRPRRGGRA